MKGHVDEADISSLPHQPARNAFGILWAGRTAPAGNAFTYQRAKNRNSEMLCLIRMAFKHTEVQLHMHAQLSIYVPLVFTIEANNGIMVIPSLPHGSTKTILMVDHYTFPTVSPVCFKIQQPNLPCLLTYHGAMYCVKLKARKPLQQASWPR